MKRIMLAIALCAFGLTGLATAQQRNGSLRGQVLDELGGAIVGATVTAIDSGGVEKSTVTNDAGNYTISGLAPGKYTLRAINAGFAMYENIGSRSRRRQSPATQCHFESRDRGTESHDRRRQPRVER